MRDDAHPFALVGAWAGGGALVGSEPVRVARADEDPFALLDEQPVVGPGSPPPAHAPSPPVAGDAPDSPPVAGGAADPPPVGGGWFGFVGYGLARRLEPIGASPPAAAPGPPFFLAFYDHLLRLDAAGRWWFEALWTDARAAALGARLETLRARAAEGVPRPGAVRTSPWRSVPGPVGHAVAVAACRERIHAGDLFQANLALRLEAALDGAPVDVFVRGVEALRPDRAAFLAGPWGAVASLSPELFLERRGRDVRSAPIKGTRPLEEAAALGASEKDRAENVMIVDLVRNDLGRVCEPGSVRVPALAETQRHAGVWHLVSEVRGRLRAGVSDAALVRAAFPPGSVTGAPKVAAMDVIAELESTARGAYTGAIGFASPLAGLELNVPIRTFEIADGRIALPVGGGVVADSDPSQEAAECLTKARPLLAAIGAGLEPPPAPGRLPVGGPPRLGPRPVPRPDPARGVYETLLAVDGEPVRLERHLARLAASVRGLYGLALPDEAERLVREAAAGAPRVRIRLDAAPAAGGGLRLTLQSGPTPAPGPVVIAPVTLPGGLGAHKWADRRLLDALAAHLAPDVPLLVDLDGFVLEAARASVFVVGDDGVLVTPPLDGRILPGITRAAVLERAAELGLSAHETPLTLAALVTAREVFLTGALRGIEPVRAGPVTASLAAAIPA